MIWWLSSTEWTKRFLVNTWFFFVCLFVFKITFVDAEMKDRSQMWFTGVANAAQTPTSKQFNLTPCDVVTVSVTLHECVPGISSKKTRPANCASISCSLILLTQVREQPGDTYCKSHCSPGQRAHVLLTHITAWLAGIREPPPVAKSLHRPSQILRSATWYWCGKCLS